MKEKIQLSRCHFHKFSSPFNPEKKSTAHSATLIISLTAEFKQVQKRGPYIFLKEGFPSAGIIFPSFPENGGNGNNKRFSWKKGVGVYIKLMMWGMATYSLWGLFSLKRKHNYNGSLYVAHRCTVGWCRVSLKVLTQYFSI